MTAEDIYKAAKERVDYRKAVIALVVAVIGGLSALMTFSEKAREWAEAATGWDTLDMVVARIDRIGERLSGVEARERQQAAQMAELTAHMLEIRQGLEALRLEAEGSSLPCIEFPKDAKSHTVDLNENGEFSFRWAFYKLRDCGRPTPQITLSDGLGNKHIIDTPVTDGRGQGVIYPVDPLRPQEIRYPGLISPRFTVHEGFGWVRVCSTYAARPRVDESCSPEVPIIISEDAAAAMSRRR